jgi:uncharacterized phiE125 gp8 family phage protein
MTALLIRLAPPTETPVTLAEAKAHLKIEHPNEDALLTDLIARATDTLDGPRGTLARCLVAQTWRVACAGPIQGRIALPMAPVLEITAARHWSAAGAEVALDPSDFWLMGDADGAWIEPAMGAPWPQLAKRADALSFDVTAGFGAPGDVPPGIRHAILLLVGHWHRNREATGEKIVALTLGVEHLVALHRRGWVG